MSKTGTTVIFTVLLLALLAASPAVTVALTAPAPANVAALPLASRPPEETRVLVVVSEKSAASPHGSWAAGGAAEAAVVRALLEAGFVVVSPFDVKRDFSSEVVLQAIESRGLANIAGRFGADVAIAGKVETDEPSSIMGTAMLSVAASLEAYVIDCASNNIVQSADTTARGVNSSGLVARKAALAKAGAQLAWVKLLGRQIAPDLNDAEGPVVALTEPRATRGVRGLVARPSHPITVAGTATDKSAVASVTVNGVPAQLEPGSGWVAFRTEIRVTAADRDLVIVAVDDRKNTSTRRVPLDVQEGGGTGDAVAAAAATAVPDRGASDAQSPAAPGRKPELYVLAVGVSKYAEERQSLQYADADAVSMAAALQGLKGRPFQDVHTRVLTNEKATRSAILTEMKSFLGQASRDDVALITVSGHGARDASTGSFYFMTYESTPSTLIANGLLMSTFNEAQKVLSQNVSKVVLIIDTCHSGAMQVGSKAAGGGEDVGQALRIAEGTYMLASSKGNELSEESAKYRLEGESGGHGAFTYAILKGLRGEADDNANGVITVAELFSYVANSVPKITEGKQHPYLKMDGTDMPLAVKK